MSKIGYGYGSEWHLLRYLGYHREVLNKSILTAVNANINVSTVDWKDFPFAQTCKYLRDDDEWTGVKAIEDASVASCWQKYWPTSGSPPNWDAVGWLNEDVKREWLLVEAKAHTKELHSACGALPKSKTKIVAALEATAKAVTNHGVTTPAWYDNFYQYANRLAVLNFLQTTCVPVTPARLIFIYFYGERVEKMKGCTCPVSQAQWQPYLDNMYAKLDINPHTPLMQRVHHVFVSINPCCKNSACV